MSAAAELLLDADKVLVRHRRVQLPRRQRRTEG
jgi:hypothetical protein